MDDNKGPVLVIGATGQQGGAAARALLGRGRTVHALVRDPGTAAARALAEAGATLVTGDLDDRSSLRAAMAPVHGVFLVLTMMSGARVTGEGVAAEERRGRAVADIARESGVGHLVYSSSSGANRGTSAPHLESKGRIEEYIRGLGLPATVLRPAFFMENFASLTRPVLAGGELVVALALRPRTRLPLISTRDIGAFAAIAFDRPARFLGRSVEIAGDDLTVSAIAEAFGRVFGGPARFHQVPIEQLRAFDDAVARMFQWLDARDVEGPDLAALRDHHPGLMNLESWLRETAWTPAPSAGTRN